MRKLEVTLETVTPVFLGGADQKPELRPPSIRGQLRYWLRAALGGIVGNQDLEVLKKTESELFGSTEGTGAVAVRASWLNSKIPALVKEDALPHKSADHPAVMDGFPAGAPFNVTLSQRDGSDDVWLSAVSAFLLTVAYGGLGRRCRRGWGSLRIIDAKWSPTDCISSSVEALLHKRPITPASWYLWGEQVKSQAVVQAQSLVVQLTGQVSRSNAGNRAYLGFGNPVKSLISAPFPNWRSAIADFGEREHQWLTEKPNLASSVGFARRRERQASPLWIRVLPVQPKDKPTWYILMATLFDVDFEGADYQAVSDFLASAGFKALEVRS